VVCVIQLEGPDLLFQGLDLTPHVLIGLLAQGAGWWLIKGLKEVQPPSTRAIPLLAAGFCQVELQLLQLPGDVINIRVVGSPWGLRTGVVGLSSSGRLDRCRAIA
jgi:hypothetical protein